MRTLTYTALNGKTRTTTVGGRRRRPVVRNHADILQEHASIQYWMVQQQDRIRQKLECAERAFQQKRRDYMSTFQNRQETDIERRG